MSLVCSSRPSLLQVLAIEEQTELDTKHHTDDVECLATSLYNEIQFWRHLAHVVKHTSNAESSHQEEGHK